MNSIQQVDGSDYSLIDSAYLTDKTNPGTATGWSNGDFNYDSLVDGSDYTLIDNAFNARGAQISAQTAGQIDGPTSSVVVPEPVGGTVLCAAMGVLSLRRRSRKQR